MITDPNTSENLLYLRRQKGFALYWWWRCWTRIGIVLMGLRAPVGLCKLCFRIGQLA